MGAIDRRMRERHHDDAKRELVEWRGDDKQRNADAERRRGGEKAGAICVERVWRELAIHL